MADINAPVESANLAHGITPSTPDKTPPAPIPTADTASAAVGRATGAAMDAAVSTQSGMFKQTVDAAISAAHDAATPAPETAIDWTIPTMPLMDICRDAAKRSADQMKTMFGTWMTVSKGVHDLQLQWLETVTQTMASTGGTPFEVWQVQRRLYVSAIDSALASTNRLLETASRSVETATHAAEVRH